MPSPATLSVLLSVIAALAAAAILLPPLLFKLASPRLAERVDADPALARPRSGDDDAEKRYGQFTALGFRPFGRTIESCWFMSPIKLYWRSLEGERWLASENRRTFVSFHRLLREEPVRFSVVSYFDGRGVLRSACPGAGLLSDEANAFWRTEDRGVEPEQLLDRHQRDLEALHARRGLEPRAMTLTEIAEAERIHGRRVITKAGEVSYGLIHVYFVAPTVLLSLYSFVTSTPHDMATVICIGAIPFGVIRLIVIPLMRRRRVLRSHSVDLTTG